MTASSTKKLIAFTHVQGTADKQILTQIHLPCPRTGKPTIYLFDRIQLYELQKVAGAGRKACWLVDNCLYQDGAVYFISPVDPLFIAIPLLDKARQQTAESQGKFRTPDDIFSTDNSTSTSEEDSEENSSSSSTKPQRLLDIPGFEDQLAHVCDCQDVAPGLRVYRLNDEKTLVWLAKKVDRVAAQLIASPSSALESATLSLSQDEKQVLYRQEAGYLIAKYLTEARFTQLLAHLSVDEIKDEIITDVANTRDDISVFFKPSATKFEEGVNNDKKRKRPDVPRSLAKVNTKGMKPLTSFFTKK